MVVHLGPILLDVEERRPFGGEGFSEGVGEKKPKVTGTWSRRRGGPRGRERGGGFVPPGGEVLCPWAGRFCAPGRELLRFGGGRGEVSPP
jgi:hypothetical protein